MRNNYKAIRAVEPPPIMLLPPGEHSGVSVYPQSGPANGKQSGIIHNL